MAKGTVSAAFALGNTVQIYVGSPTGDSSDAQVLVIQCLNNDQAEAITQVWRATWNIPSEFSFAS